MSKYMTKYHAADLLNTLADEGLTERNQELSDFILSQQQEKELPLYIGVLIGIGAFIASFCFIGFLGAAKIISFKNETDLIIWGLIFIAAAIGLQQLAGPDNTVKHSFFIQSSFTSMAVGKMLFVFGTAKIMDSGWGASIAMLIITGVTYHIYRMPIDRFLSSFAVIFSILMNILVDQKVSGARELLFNGFFLLQIASAAILLTHGKVKRDYIPLSYAFVFSLCASILFLTPQAKFGYWQHKELIHLAFVNIVLTGGLIALFGWAAGGMEKLKSPALVLASSGAVLFGLVSAPGIIFAIGLMILGYAKHDKLLITLGGLLIAIFLFLYYYNLDISLMHKSGILLGSGILLLVGRLYLQYKGWDKGGISCTQK